MHQPVDSFRHMDEGDADRCRRSLGEEQARSLAETDGWAHVDKDRVHADWDALYSEIAVFLDGARPEDDRAQELIERHVQITSRFYAPTREAYIGMAMLYAEDAAMKEFHNAYHPRMVEFLGLAMRAYADKRLRSGPRRPTPAAPATSYMVVAPAPKESRDRQRPRTGVPWRSVRLFSSASPPALVRWLGRE